MTRLHGFPINVGDIVYDRDSNELKIISTNSCMKYPIEAALKTYTENGMYYGEGKYPSIFWQPLEITDEQLKKAMTKPKKMVTKYRVIATAELGEYLTGDYFINQKDFEDTIKDSTFICLVKELSKEFEE